jgi:hypothetical protein
MASRISPYVDNTGLVFAYDLANVQRSYLGEPTINLHPSPEDVSSWTGNLFNNWISSAVTSNTTIAPDGTLTADRLGDGYGRFNASVSITAGQTYTYSVYLKNVNLTNGFGIVYAWGLNGTLVSYGTAYNVSIAEISTGEWTRVTTTITAPGSGVNQVQFGPCPFTGYGNPSGQQLDVWGGHIENKSHATPYVNGTRSVTQGLKDLRGNSTIDLTNVSFDANAQMTFDGTDDYITAGNNPYLAPGTGNFTYSCWINPAGYSYYAGLLVVATTGGLWIGKLGSNMVLRAYNVEDYLQYSTLPTVGQWTNVVITRAGTTVTLYYNANSVATATTGYNFVQATAYIGNDGPTSSANFNGKIASTSFYNRALPASEIQQNFNAIKGRYGL